MVSADHSLRLILSPDQIARDIADEFVQINDLYGAAVGVVDRFEARRDELQSQILPHVQAGMDVINLIALQETHERLDEVSRG